MDGLNREEQEEGLMVVMVRDHLHDLQPCQCLDQLDIGASEGVLDDNANRIGVLLDELPLLQGSPKLEEVVAPLELLLQKMLAITAVRLKINHMINFTLGRKRCNTIHMRKIAQNNIIIIITTQNVKQQLKATEHQDLTKMQQQHWGSQVQTSKISRGN
nr:hypothetical protein CFP56_35213 [Quercus suber]